MFEVILEAFFLFDGFILQHIVFHLESLDDLVKFLSFGLHGSFLLLKLYTFSFEGFLKDDSFLSEHILVVFYFWV